MGTLLDKMSGLFKKADDTEARYEKALEDKEQSLLVLQKEIQDKQVELTDLHKMCLLGDLEQSYFDEKNDDFLKLQAKYRQGQTEVEMIKQYKVADVTEILEELQSTQKDYSASESAEVNKMKLELLEAKLNYLKKMREVATRYNKTLAPANRIKQMQYKLGLKKNVYIADTYESLSMYSVPNGGYVNLRIENPDIHNAITTGTVNGDLKRLVTDAREKGILK